MRIKFTAFSAISALVVLLHSPVCAERSFFVFDNGLTDVESVEEQAKLLKELGIAGMCTRPKNATKELLAAFDKREVDLPATYISLPAGADVPPSIVQHLQSLKGRDIIVWLTLTETKASDEKAVETIRKIFDLAKESGLETVLYPHVGCRTSSVKRCEEFRKLAKRPGLGLSFSLCHFLSQHQEQDLEQTIKSIAPHLKLVQINGANRIPTPKSDWDQLILPLGEGDFDVGRVFRALDEIGYDGPVNLQCYNIKQPARKHLGQSIKGWKALNQKKDSK